MLKSIGAQGKAELIDALNSCGIVRGFEHGFAAIILKHPVHDLTALSKAEADKIREQARQLAEYESLARFRQALIRERTEKPIPTGMEWLE